MLELKEVEKTFDVGTVNEKRAVKPTTLTLNDGDFVIVIGGNGAGKSTLLNLVAGSLPVDRGEIVVDGTAITKMPEHKRAKFLGRVFQDPFMGTAADMEICENLAIAERRGKRPTLRWGLKKKQLERYAELLARFDLGIENGLTKKVGTLSGGQRQALTLLMATIAHPKLLLLDEHTAALDPKTAKKVLCLTKSLVEENKLTTLMITHNMTDALEYGNRLIMMNDGQIIFDAKGDEKKKLTVQDLLKKFEESGTLSDRVALS